MKLSNSRVVRSSTQPAENPRILPQMHSRSNPPSRATRRNHRENEQTRRVPGQMRCRRRAHQRLRRRSRPAVPMSSKPQKGAKQHHQTRWSSQKRSALHRPYYRKKAHRANARRIYAPDRNRNGHRANRYQRRRNRPVASMSSKPQRRLRQHHLRHWKKIHHVSARTIYAPEQKHRRRRAYQRQRRRSKVAALMSSGQRNPAQKNRLRGITFIRSDLKSGLRTVCRRKKLRRFVKSRKHRKSVVRRDPKLHQQNHPLFVM